jgi:division protein CdvB (Snf7/Vps24/ESCRT-III family)
MTTYREDRADYKLQSLKNRVKNIDTIPFSELQNWEVKEYLQVKKMYVDEIEELEAHILKYPHLFNK